MNNNINSRPRRRPQRTAKQQIAAMKRSAHGHKNILNWSAPPQVTARPWYNLVLDLVIANAATDTYFSPKSLITRLCTQLGLPSQAASVINIKAKRVDAFTMATGASTDRPAISMDVSSTQPSVGDPLTPGNAEVFYGVMKKLSDQGNLSDAAKVSYTWPTAQADVPLSSQSVFSLVSVAGNQPNTCVRVHVLWSTTDIAVPLDP